MTTLPRLRPAVRVVLLDPDDRALLVHRTHVFPMENGYGERFDGQEEWYYLVRTGAFDPRGTLTDDEAQPPVLTAPRGLPDLLARLAADGPPAEPLELDV